MSTPNAVLERPDTAAPLGALAPHGAALLLRGIDLRLTQLNRLHELDVMGVEAFSERSDPLVQAAGILGRALEQWTAAQSWPRRDGDDSVDASWPAEPRLPEAPLTVVQLWETRLAADYVAIATIDETPGEYDLDALQARHAPVRALYDVVLSSLLAAGFSEHDL